jgi:hypothetical protein
MSGLVDAPSHRRADVPEACESDAQRAHRGFLLLETMPES